MALDNIYDQDAMIAKKAQSQAVALTFLYMVLGLLVTAAVCFGLGYGLWAQIGINESVYPIYYGVMIGCGVAQIVLMLVMVFAQIKGNPILTGSLFFLYALCMGGLLSSFCLWLDPSLMGGAFGVTALVFAGMGLIGYFTKGKMTTVAMIASGLIFGCCIMVFFNLIMMFWLAPAVWNAMYWVISMVMLVAILLITAYDVHRFKNDIKAGATNHSICLFYAYQFYLDFIFILLRVLYLFTYFKN